MPFKMDINPRVVELNQLLFVIKEDINQEINKKSSKYDVYMNDISQIRDMNLFVANENVIKNNYINETSYFVVLTKLYSEYVRYKFNLNVKSTKLAKILDSKGFYDWYKIKGKLALSVKELAKKILDEKISSDFFSDFYESLLDISEKKRLGQFYTPIEIVDLIINETKIDSDDFILKKSIIDPACGAGVFLTRIIERLHRLKKYNFLELARYANSNLYGNDINPFAVILTKLNLSFILLEKITDRTELKAFIEKFSHFPNIKFQDTLMDYGKNDYDLIVGNPPYFKTTSGAELSFYKEIIYGQPNKYGLFLYWSLKHVAGGGIVSFIIPQSFKSGQYFSKLRKLLSQYKILSLINFKSRTKIFKGVEQAVLILTVQNLESRDNSVHIVNKVNNYDNTTTSFIAPQQSVIMNKNYNYFIFIPSTEKIINLIDKIYNDSTNLSVIGSYMFGTGAFVWNQHKSKLSTNSDKDTVPIIYSGFIEKNQFIFKDITSEKSGKKLFAKYDNSISGMISTGQKLIVQRTSTYEEMQRIKACLINEEFLNENPRYLLENHVNFLFQSNDKSQQLNTEDMIFYLAVFNSRLLNIIFSVKNGNTQVSASELNLLPISYKMKNEIVDTANRHQGQQLYNILDELIYENYSLTHDEIDTVRNYIR